MTGATCVLTAAAAMQRGIDVAVAEDALDWASTSQ